MKIIVKQIEENGKLHQVSYSINYDGTCYKEVWRLGANIHREKGPAIIYYNKMKKSYWYQNGLKHRENGPAESSSKSHDIWFYKGVRHRKDGPAVIYENDYLVNKYGKYHWYLNGYNYTLENFLRILEKEIININGVPYLKDGRRIKGLE